MNEVIEFKCWHKKLECFFEHVAVYPSGTIGIDNESFEDQLPKRFEWDGEEVTAKDIENDDFKYTPLVGEDWLWFELKDVDIEIVTFPGITNIEKNVAEWMNWTEENFPKSGAQASLIHLQEEVKEVLAEMDSDVPNHIQENGVALLEYADCLICLLTAAGKSGFSAEQLFTAVKNKMGINYKRKWELNANGTYSHIK